MALQIGNLTIKGSVRSNKTSKSSLPKKVELSAEQIDSIKREILSDCSRMIKQQSRKINGR